MSTLSEASKVLESTGGDTQRQSLAIEMIGMLANREGGLNGLVQTFEQNRLGHIISSWIGNGRNLPISADQVRTVLGSQCVADLAKNAGIAPDKAAEHLTGSLPYIIDALTPNGRVGRAEELQSLGREILAAFITKKPQ